MTIDEIVIDPTYLWTNHPRNLSFGAPLWDRYELLKLLCVFNKAYVDRKWFMEISSRFDREKTKIDEIFARLFDEGILIDLPFESLIKEHVNPAHANLNYEKCFSNYPDLDPVLYTAVLRRLHKMKPMVVLRDRYEAGLACIATSVDVAVGKNMGVLTSSWTKDAVILFGTSYTDQQLQNIKLGLKKIEFVKFILSAYIPNFSVKPESIEAYLEVRTNSLPLNVVIESWAQNYGGFEIGENEKKEILNLLSEARLELGKITDLFDKIEFGADVGLDVFSILVAIPFLGTAKSIIAKIFENKRIEEKELQWMVYLGTLLAFQTKRISKTSRCSLCTLSEPEIEKMSEDRAHGIATSGRMCVGHTVTYLTVRKQIARGVMGKKALLLTKKFEKEIGEPFLGEPLIEENDTKGNPS